MEKQVNSKIKFVFDNRILSSMTFANYYDVLFNMDTYKSRKAIETIEDYFDMYVDDEDKKYYEYTDDYYDDCPDEIRQEITDLIAEAILDYLTKLLNNQNDVVKDILHT